MAVVKIEMIIADVIPAVLIRREDMNWRLEYTFNGLKHVLDPISIQISSGLIEYAHDFITREIAIDSRFITIDGVQVGIIPRDDHWEVHWTYKKIGFHVDVVTDQGLPYVVEFARDLLTRRIGNI